MEAAIDRCCDLKTLEDNWSEILNIADTYAVAQPKKCLKCITGKIFQPNPNISLKAITLLDACVKNAGNTFARELSSKDFVSHFKQKYPKLQEKPRMKLLELTRQWANDYKNNPEFNLLTTIYMWVQHEYPHDITALKTTQNIAKKLQKKAADRDLRAKEEEDIAKAIALSLNDTKNSASQNQQTGQPEPSSSSTYPSVHSPPTAVNGKKELGCVRALFDFEAAEDNELTFKAGDIITLVDDSDPNWWKGSNHNGEGLFPAQFVSRDLNSGGNEADVLNKREKVEQVTSQKPVRIDPQLVDNCLEMLGDADTTGVARPDPDDLPVMEQQCRDMEPLIEAELEGVYTRISEVDVLKQRLTETLTQYHELVTNRAMPAQPQPPPQVFQPTTTTTTTSSSFANPAFNPPAQYTLPPVAYPQPMMFQPGPPPPNPPYQPNHVPPPMPPFAPPAAVGAPVPAGGGGAPAMYGAPMPVYGHQAAYGYPMDLNAWQQQPMPTQQPLQHPLPPQHMQPPAVVYGAPSANPSASTYNVG